MTIKIPGYSTLTGRPATILKLMQSARFFDSPEGDAYIEAVVKDCRRAYGIKLNVEGETYDERAESLLRELDRHDFIIITQE